MGERKRKLNCFYREMYIFIAKQNIQHYLFLGDDRSNSVIKHLHNNRSYQFNSIQWKIYGECLCVKQKCQARLEIVIVPNTIKRSAGVYCVASTAPCQLRNKSQYVDFTVHISFFVAVVVRARARVILFVTILRGNKSSSQIWSIIN